jgi:hypothetical protein
MVYLQCNELKAETGVVHRRIGQQGKSVSVPYKGLIFKKRKIIKYHYHSNLQKKTRDMNEI